MSELITEKAWRQIVAASAWRQIVAAGTGAGTRGKVFRMSADTLKRLARERGLTVPPVTLYSVPIVLDSIMRDGDVLLEER